MKFKEGQAGKGDTPANVHSKHSAPAPSKSENRPNGGQMKGGK